MNRSAGWALLGVLCLIPTVGPAEESPLPQAWADAMGVESAAGVRYPIASEEVSAAFGWAAGSGLATASWALGGASAGANLATGATLRLVDGAGPVPALVVLAYPTLHAVQGEPSADLRRALDADPAADVFGPEAVLGMYENYLGGPVDDATPLYAVPGKATPVELAGFPPTIIVNSEVDELRVSGEAFAATLAAAGVDVDVVTEAGTTHGHLNQPDHPGATATLDRFAARILALAP